MRRRTQPTREATIDQLLDNGNIREMKIRIEIMEREIDYIEDLYDGNYDADKDIDTLEEWIMMLQMEIARLEGRI